MPYLWNEKLSCISVSDLGERIENSESGQVQRWMPFYLHSTWYQRTAAQPEGVPNSVCVRLLSQLLCSLSGFTHCEPMISRLNLGT